MMPIPVLNRSDRAREFNDYTPEQRAEVVKAYLFDGLSHRKLDEEILKIDTYNSNGWQSMGILHYLGLNNPFKGIFKDKEIEEAINMLKSEGDDYNEIVSILESFKFNETIKDDISLENASEYSILKEGQQRLVFTTRYERKPQLRSQAIKIHGTTCMACGFNFEEVYGIRGKDYIEVHHIKPLSQNDESVEVDPASDLIVVCANCHRIIHRKRNEILSLDELKDLIN